MPHGLSVLQRCDSIGTAESGDEYRIVGKADPVGDLINWQLCCRKQSAAFFQSNSDQIVNGSASVLLGKASGEIKLTVAKPLRKLVKVQFLTEMTVKI